LDLNNYDTGTSRSTIDAKLQAGSRSQPTNLNPSLFSQFMHALFGEETCSEGEVLQKLRFTILLGKSEIRYSKLLKNKKGCCQVLFLLH
jgi:hypothetical protein